MSAALEQQYRQALRWYPKNWRRRNEDAVVGTLLDVAEEAGRLVPARGELADLRANGFASHLGPLGRIPASVRDRAVALIFGLGAGIAIVAVVASAWQAATTPAYMLPYYSIVGPFLGYSFMFYGVWIIALIAALIGWRRIATALVLAGIPLSIAIRLMSIGLRIDYAPTTTTILLMAMLALLTLIGNPFRRRRGRLWIAVSTASWAAGIGFTIWYQHVTMGGVAGSTDWFIGPFSQWMGFAAPFVIILALVLWRVARSPWALAILIAEVPILLFAIFGWQDVSTIEAELAVGVGALVIVAAVIGILRAFGLRITITRAR
jgi:hypothetical protein